MLIITTASKWNLMGVILLPSGKCLKQTSNRKEAIEEQLCNAFDFPLPLKLFGSIPIWNKIHWLQ